MENRERERVRESSNEHVTRVSDVRFKCMQRNVIRALEQVLHIARGVIKILYLDRPLWRRLDLSTRATKQNRPMYLHRQYVRLASRIRLCSLLSLRILVPQLQKHYIPQSNSILCSMSNIRTRKNASSIILLQFQ